ncbi:MAG: DUF5718 family protein [Candidatus Polarisedimenticolaceae bacterium]|nr:DUF5718 family protein [Candidatus Polarisedimenticolaceae bacterium]
MSDYKKHIGFGIAGNFALHLEQAGELEDFKDVETEDENGPKGMFPFYLPGMAGQLGEFPLCSHTITLPSGKVNVQAEPEVGLICTLSYEDGKVSAIQPTHFAAYNDCSIRKAGAKKISEKKNWGASSKGLSKQLIAIDKFEQGGVMDRWRIASFLRREENLMRYGEDVELSGYSYFYDKLCQWMKNQINTQQDKGPLEPLLEYIEACHYPEHAVISIGATRYTPFGESNFLKAGDEVVIVLYDAELHSQSSVMEDVIAANYSKEGVSYLVKRVVHSE